MQIIGQRQETRSFKEFVGPLEVMNPATGSDLSRTKLGVGSVRHANATTMDETWIL